MPTWQVDALFLMLAMWLGVFIGWLVRGSSGPREKAKPEEKPRTRRDLAEEMLRSLHAAADTLRSCVEEHTECIQQIESEFRESSATEPAVLTSAVQSIQSANGLIQNQFSDIQRVLDENEEEFKSSFGFTDTLLFTFATLDRQKLLYRKVLHSLETLAAEMAGGMENHGQRLQEISSGLDQTEVKGAEDIQRAAAQILTATEEIEHCIDATEEQLEEQAEKVQMQAVLSHIDLLTSLPNRRAFEAELNAEPEPGTRPNRRSVVMIDMDQFALVNQEYGHQGGELVLSQTAGLLRQLVDSKDLVARYGGDAFVFLLNSTTLHDALPVAEKARHELEEALFSHGNRPLRVTASLGVAQVQPEESGGSVVHRALEALKAAKEAGRNLCFWHDGKECNEMSSAFRSKDRRSSLSTLELLEGGGTGQSEQNGYDEFPDGEIHSDRARRKRPREAPALSGRSIFVANVKRRLEECDRGGPSVSVALLRVDQFEELTERFGPQAQRFLRGVIGRLFEAATRDMDERCEFEDGVFSILLPGTNETSARAVAERLRTQVQQCKVRMADDLWSLTASIGVAHADAGTTMMDLMLGVEGALKEAIQLGGDNVCEGEILVAEPSTP